MKTKPWSCPSCARTFTQLNQRHACGVGKRADVLQNRPAELVRLYEAVEKFVTALGPIEIVTRERYALFRSTRIFADLVVMKDVLRLAIHLRREATDDAFFKVAREKNKFTHVAKLKSLAELRALKPYLKEAYEASLAGPTAFSRSATDARPIRSGARRPP